MNNRRAALRRSVVDSHLITVDLAFQSGALLLDLSESGMGVQALSSAPIGTTTSLCFELPETGGRVDGVGRIAWTDSSGRLGIRFDDIAELSRLHLSQWLSEEGRPAPPALPHPAMPAWPPLHLRDEIAALRRDLTTEKLEGDAALGFVVERVRSVIRATGAVIALEQAGEILCRASSGNAPPIGATVDPNAGLSGECIRTGEIVRCEDTETDPRADRLVCRRLQLRSIVIVPVRCQGRPAGVLEAFSSQARAFQSSDVLMLRRVSDLVAEIALPKPDSAAPPAEDTPPLIAAALLQPFGDEPEAESIPVLLQEILTLDDGQDSAAAVADDPSSPAPTSLAGAVLDSPGGTAPVTIPSTPEADSTPPPLSRLTGPNAAAPGAAVPQSVRGTLPEPEEEEEVQELRSMLLQRRQAGLRGDARRRRSRTVPLAAAAAMVLLLAVAAWQIWYWLAAPAAATAAADQPARATPAISPGISSPAPQTQSIRAALPVRAQVTKAPEHPSAPRANTPPVNPAPQEEPQPIKVREPDLQQAAEAPAVAPSLGAGSRPAGEPTSIAGLLAAPVASPKLDTPSVPTLTGGRLVKKVNPLYPSSALGLHGEVVLRATVDRQGRVTKVQIVRGQAILAQEAAAAVKRWRYEPFRLNGKAIEVENTIVVNFEAPGPQQP